MEILNIISFIFITIAFFGGLVFPVLFTILAYHPDENKYQAYALALLWLILIAVLAGVGAYITY